MAFRLCVRLCFFLVLVTVITITSYTGVRPADALTVTGVPEWLEPAVLRSLKAVWSEIPIVPNIDRPGTLMIVASRLFVGYQVTVDTGSGMTADTEATRQDVVGKNAGEPVVQFTRAADRAAAHAWSVKLVEPDIRGLAHKWFMEDIRGLDEDILQLLEPLPAMALTWADSAFEDRVRVLVSDRLPGWDFSIQIALASSSSSKLLSYANHVDENGINLQEQSQVSQVTITFRPSQSPTEPLVLAVQPALHSRTLPAMFRNDLEARLVPELSPLVGVPVRWTQRHKKDVEDLAREFLEDRNAVSNMRAHVNVTFVPGLVSGLSARIDSDRLSFQMWIAAYAGLDGRYPEAGLFLGWNLYEQTGLELELYLESIFELNDFTWTRRIGARAHLFTLLNTEFWGGAEISWPGGDWFARIQWGPSKIRRPYLWWRWSPDVGHEGAIGYQFDEHVSLEIYYGDLKNENRDNSNGSKIGLRGIWNL